MLEVFKNKNANNYDNNILGALSFEDLLNNKKSNFNENTQVFFNKINSDYSLSEKFNEKNEEKKKIITDNKIKELCENNSNNEINEKLVPLKLGIFSNSSLAGLESYPPPLIYDAFNRQQSSNLDSNINLRFQPLPSTSFLNSLNHQGSLGNLNNHIITPRGINKTDILNYYNNIKTSNSNINLVNNNSNNMLQINPEICTKKTLLSPPPPRINNYVPPFLANLSSQTPLLQTGNESNINNLTFSTSINEKNLLKENEKASSTLNMFNKKRKRDIKNNKLVFISGDNKKEKKEIKKQKINNEIHQSKDNSKKNDENSEKNRKPRGSKFRGVSRNGNQWQVLIMVNKKKRYVGSYSKEEDAARAYDKVALQNHGSKAKTNFDYTKKEVEEILASPQLLKLN